MGKINSFYKSTIEEASVDSYGYNFLCVYGSHINGNYLAILNWGISVELSSFSNDITYNAMSLGRALENIPQLKANASNIAYDIANTISPRLKEMQDKENVNNHFGNIRNKLELLDEIIDGKCQIDGIGETIEELLNYGASKETLIACGFQEEDINNILEEQEKEDIDI